MKYALTLCLVMALSCLCLAQQTIVNDKQLAHQRMIASLDGLRDQIKAMDEPALRVFVRIRAANFLWAGRSADASQRAETMATEALADMQDHQSEIPSLYSMLFRRELLAALQIHAPALASRLIKKYELEKSAADMDTAYEMLDSENGVGKAVEIMRRNMQSDSASFIANSSFAFNRLDERQPAEVTRLLSDLISSAESAPNSYSVSSLFLITHFYLFRKATPPELQSRFLALLIRATRDPATLSQGDRINGYNLLRGHLPTIQKLLPSLYLQASAQLAILASQHTKQTFERDDVDEIIDNSSDPLNQMIIEADAAKDESLRRRLLSRASEMALQKGKLKLAVDSIIKIETTDKSETIPYRDQFLREVVNQAIAEKDLTIADYAASKIDADLKRAAAIQTIAFYVFKSKDVGGARDRLAGALKLINAADNGVEKASALFRSIPVCAKVDEQRVSELIPAAIKVVNDLPGPKSEDKPDSESHKAYVNMLLQVAYNVIPAFRALAGTNENEAFYLAGNFQRQEIKAAAIFGAATGIRPPANAVINTNPNSKPTPAKQQPQN